jgi:hypothetical protein
MGTVAGTRTTSRSPDPEDRAVIAHWFMPPSTERIARSSDRTV